MRASPAIDLTIRHFGIWHGCVAALVVITVAAVSAWVVQVLEQRDPVLLAGACLATLLAAVVAVRGTRSAPTRLRWDGVGWRLSRLPTSTTSACLEHPECEGELSVVLDLGFWMLLRFSPVGAAPTRRAVWLPVQRKGLEAQWHSLRCAVHARRGQLGTP